MVLFALVLAHDLYRKVLAARIRSCSGAAVEEIPFPLYSEPKFYAEEVGPWVHSQFERVAGQLETFAAQHGGPAALRRTVALLDLCSLGWEGWGDFEPLHQSKHPAASLAALLMLAFPEVHWVLFSPTALPCSSVDAPSANGPGPWNPQSEQAKVLPLLEFAHHLDPALPVEIFSELQAMGYVALFDPCGLRQAVYRRLGGKTTEDKASIATNAGRTDRHRVDRTADPVALVLDEEIPYAFSNSYVAYRFGYRVLTVTTWKGMVTWLGSGKGRTKSGTGIKIKGPVIDDVLEDAYLNFPDRPRNLEGGRLSDLSVRDGLFEALRHIKNQRIFVSVGHERSPAIRELHQSNRLYLEAKPYRSRWVYKPVGGVHHLVLCLINRLIFGGECSIL